MVQSINNAGSQQALESNWNDENAMRKFERAADGATRQRKHEILDDKQRPNSVELGANSKSINQKPLAAPPQTSLPPDKSSSVDIRSNIAPAIQNAEAKPAPSAKSRYVAATVLTALIAIIACVIYLA
ncbi:MULTISPECIES: hypothetical protein [unclassified Phyllobacterium]|uniref:hypothetical protein n=1 Tax=unclassified Phyllobacterium TaxID=2638441 RepID=UPI000E0F922B